MNVHTRDAGDLGCADGLANWFRAELRATPVGDNLRAIVRDPGAREELPALARLMGQRVLALEAADGCFVITVEKIT